MAETAFRGNLVNTVGELPTLDGKAPAFELVGADLSTKTLASFAGKRKVLTINPSYDTGVCQAAARAFNQRIAGQERAERTRSTRARTAAANEASASIAASSWRCVAR